VNRLKPQRPELAELARMCLDHLVADPESLGRFMVEAGYDPGSLRGALGTPDFKAGLIDYFARNEPMMLAVSAANGIRPEDFMAVWHRLNPSV
jgi:hypothetical protein